MTHHSDAASPHEATVKLYHSAENQHQKKNNDDGLNISKEDHGLSAKAHVCSANSHLDIINAASEFTNAAPSSPFGGRDARPRLLNEIERLGLYPGT
jgi:hypothetical protein